MPSVSPFLGGLLSRERFKELFVARTGVHAQASVLQFMAELNAVPKLEDAPWSTCVHLLTDHRGAWIECPTSGFGFVYATLLKRCSLKTMKGPLALPYHEHERA